MTGMALAMVGQLVVGQHAALAIERILGDGPHVPRG
jgi:hypothetical protein